VDRAEAMIKAALEVGVNWLDTSVPVDWNLRLGGEGGEVTDVAVHPAPNPGPHGPPQGGRTTPVDLPAAFDDVGDDLIPSRLGSQRGG
jgi:hypothetical protein